MKAVSIRSAFFLISRHIYVPVPKKNLQTPVVIPPPYIPARCPRHWIQTAPSQPIQIFQVCVFAFSSSSPALRIFSPRHRCSDCILPTRVDHRTWTKVNYQNWLNIFSIRGPIMSQILRCGRNRKRVSKCLFHVCGPHHLCAHLWANSWKNVAR